jgi:hypothetical protein
VQGVEPDGSNVSFHALLTLLICIRRMKGGLKMAKMSKEVMEVFNDPSSAKVLATAGSTALEVNAVPKGSLRAVSEEVIAFADIFGDKTNKNLQLNKKVSALAFKTSPVAGYQVKGTFLGYHTNLMSNIEY